MAKKGSFVEKSFESAFNSLQNRTKKTYSAKNFMEV
jgi:hypothetical protein